MKLKRFEGNPILSPHSDHPWEDLAVFNPAAWHDEERRKVLLLFRTAESQPDYKYWPPQPPRQRRSNLRRLRNE